MKEAAPAERTDHSATMLLNQSISCWVSGIQINRKKTLRCRRIRPAPSSFRWDPLSSAIARLFIGEIKMGRYDVFRHEHETKVVHHVF
ncbi:hypothetical protein MOV61_00480 [Neorhizobium sp. BETTINA12A]|uniref:hypothetical protein n=1 Tax=Neorhizobium sp. BETTINA12A TaxID=2908924 RepID=UPI001FF35505|nr:hypothetical protein [Neorhizobium sp. BETTINA12A]MCJ9749186.1 hypothetical protein [Neorhizobium sp. BETTINA12A]